MIRIDEKSRCSGCGACTQRCPANAIFMAADAEGFLYPCVSQEICTRCGLCVKTCPVLKAEPEKPRKQCAWIAQHRDKNILRECTSGGAFSAIAERTLDNGGVVYGAALSEDFRVIHRAVRDRADLAALRGSKYVQSDVGETFRKAEKDLKDGRSVVYSGTPCQIEGFRRFLGRDYPNLLLIDVVCHATPSPMIWSKYMEYLRTKTRHQDIQAYYFRDKRPYGYQMSTLSAWSGNCQVYCGHISVDPYLRAFFANLSDRPSCYDCKFKKRYRVSDLTIWDCFNPKAFLEDKSGLSEKDGASCVLAQSEKGRIAVMGAESLRLFPVDADALCSSAKEMTRSVPLNKDRDNFFRDAESMDGFALFEKWFPVRLKNRLVCVFRAALARSGLTIPVRELVKKVSKQLQK